MTKLFIIGNGFDIFHNMKTKYTDFRKFLVKNYLKEDLTDTLYYEIPYPNQEEIYDDKDCVRAIINILDETEPKRDEWNEVETSLGNLDYGVFLDDYGLYDKNNIKETYYRNESCSIALCGALKQIDCYFQKWIETIKIAKIPKDTFKNMIDIEKDLFLTFNYTKTLESLYNAKNVCHIHGTIDDYIYFGHNNDEYNTDSIQRQWFGAENEINNLQNMLRKNTIEAYTNNIGFFNNLEILSKNETIDMYSFGFSFSSVDQFYLQQIFRIADTHNSTFYINSYHDKSERKSFENILRLSGFKGKIAIYDT